MGNLQGSSDRTGCAGERTRLLTCPPRIYAACGWKSACPSSGAIRETLQHDHGREPCPHPPRRAEPDDLRGRDRVRALAAAAVRARLLRIVPARPRLPVTAGGPRPAERVRRRMA